MMKILLLAMALGGVIYGSKKASTTTATAPLSATSGNVSLTTCASGQVYQVVGGVWACTTPYTGGWRTVFDCDFTTEASQTLGSDTTYTVCGVVMTKVYSANERSAMAITHGTGLVVSPTASHYLGATATLPALTIPLSTLVPGFTLETPLRMSLYQVSDNRSSAEDGSMIGVKVSTANMYYFSGLGETGGSSSGIFARQYYGSTSYITTGTTTAPCSTATVAVLSIPGVTQGALTASCGTYSAGWPTSYTAAIGNMRADEISGWIPSIGATSDWQLVIGAQASGNTVYTATIGRIKLETR